MATIPGVLVGFFSSEASATEVARTSYRSRDCRLFRHRDPRGNPVALVLDGKGCGLESAEEFTFVGKVYPRTYEDCCRRGFAKLQNGDVIDHCEWIGGGISVTRICRPNNSRYWISAAMGTGLREQFESSMAAFDAAKKVLDQK